MIFKKAAVGVGLAWFVAVIIIMLTMIFLLAGSMVLAAQKSVPVFGEGRDEIVLKVHSEDLNSKRDLINFLNSPAKSGDKNVMESVLESTDNYFEITSSPEKGSLMEWYYNKNDYYRIGLDRISPSDAESEGFNKDEVVNALNENKEIASEIVGKLKAVCSQFIIFTPHGVITEKGIMALNVREVEEYFSDDFEGEKWTPAVSLKFYYKGQDFEIKFRQLKECSK